jgi:hypothetical protein
MHEKEAEEKQRKEYLKESKDDEKRRRRRRLVLWLGIIVIIFVILTVIKVRISWADIYRTEVPSGIIEAYASQGPSAQDCEERNYSWTYEWLGWQPTQNSSISPIFKIINNENERGEFEVYFIFFDDHYWAYEEYGTKTYDEVKDKLPLSAVSFYSDRLKVDLGPKEEKVIIEYTEKTNPAGNYWAYAIVNPPKLQVCKETGVIYNNTSDASMTDYIPQRNAEVMTARVPLWLFLWIMFVR